MFILLITLVSVSAQVKLEYVAHSCFVIESPQGVRILIDPYNTNRWLGYQFPDEMKADAVLVTHPHYNHDANYHVSFQVPVFRAPGRFSIGDVRLQGLKGKHADPYGKDFGQRNTIWVVEAGGKRFVHLGDNGPLTEQLVKDLGTVTSCWPLLTPPTTFSSRQKLNRSWRPSSPVSWCPCTIRSRNFLR